MPNLNSKNTVDQKYVMLYMPITENQEIAKNIILNGLKSDSQNRIYKFSSYKPHSNYYIGIKVDPYNTIVNYHKTTVVVPIIDHVISFDNYSKILLQDYLTQEVAENLYNQEFDLLPMHRENEINFKYVKQSDLVELSLKLQEVKNKISLQDFCENTISNNSILSNSFMQQENMLHKTFPKLVNKINSNYDFFR